MGGTLDPIAQWQRQMERELGSSADPQGLNTAERCKQGITGLTLLISLQLLGGTGSGQWEGTTNPKLCLSDVYPKRRQAVKFNLIRLSFDSIGER